MEAEKHANVAKIEAERGKIPSLHLSYFDWIADATISRILQQQKTGEVEAEAERKALGTFAIIFCYSNTVV